MSTSQEFTEAIDWASDEIAELAVGSQLSILVLAARHLDGGFVGLQRINELAQYTLYDSPLPPSATLAAVWNLGFAAGVAYIEGVRPADVEAENITDQDVIDTFEELGIAIQFEGDEEPF